jgi:phytanoyl-CoA hydroxylase
VSIESQKAYYDREGYVIYRGLVDAGAIDALLEEYRSSILHSQEYFFRQSSNRWEKNILSTDGYSQSSFLDIHDYKHKPRFTLMAKQVFCSKAMRSALREVTGSEQHNLMQSMLFDQNTATPAHQDHYYLDSVPSGHLLGAWIALEDIAEEAGRFFVVPKSHNHRFDLTPEEKISNHLYKQKINAYMSEKSSDAIAPELRKGDVLFWHSFTVHGSTPTKNRKFSRKSLTAHYIPAQYQFGNMHNVAFATAYETFEGMKYRLNEKKYSVGASLKYEIKNFLDLHPNMRQLVNVIKQPFVSK